MSERTARVDELLRQEISAIITREVQDPGVGFVTVTRVEVSPDLGHARVWVSMIGQPEERRKTFAALVRAMPFVRRELGVLRLRRIPQLQLRVDDSVERGTRVLHLLEDLEAGREPVETESGETLPTPGPPEFLAPEPARDAASRRRAGRRGEPPAAGRRQVAGGASRSHSSGRARHGASRRGGGGGPTRGGGRGEDRGDDRA